MALLARMCSAWSFRILLLLTIISAGCVILYMSGLTDNNQKLDRIRKFKAESESSMAEAMDLDMPEDFEPVFQHKIVHLDLKVSPAIGFLKFCVTIELVHFYRVPLQN